MLKHQQFEPKFEVKCFSNSKLVEELFEKFKLTSALKNGSTFSWTSAYKKHHKNHITSTYKYMNSIRRLTSTIVHINFINIHFWTKTELAMSQLEFKTYRQLTTTRHHIEQLWSTFVFAVVCDIINLYLTPLQKHYPTSWCALINGPDN